MKHCSMTWHQLAKISLFCRRWLFSYYQCVPQAASQWLRRIYSKIRLLSAAGQQRGDTSYSISGVRSLLVVLQLALPTIRSYWKQHKCLFTFHVCSHFRGSWHVHLRLQLITQKESDTPYWCSPEEQLACAAHIPLLYFFFYYYYISGWPVQNF